MAAPGVAKADDSSAPDGAVGPAPRSLVQPLKVDLSGLERRAATPGAKKTMEIEQLLINIGLLMMQSPAHRYFFLADLEWLVYPAVQHRQFKLYMKEGRPIAYVSWARLSEQAEARFSVAGRLSPPEWTSGDRLWLVDILTPFGTADEVIRDLHGGSLQGLVFKYWANTAQGRRVVTVRPVEKPQHPAPAADPTNDV